MARTLSHVIGFDDAPFDRHHRGNVLVVGTVFNRSRLEGVLTGQVRRDGVNSTRVLAQLIRDCRYSGSLQAVLLQGVTLAGFNVVDLHALHEASALPVIAITRKRPDLDKVQRALLTRVPGGRRKWQLIERLGPMEAVAGVYIQRVGISLTNAEALIRRFAINSRLPEPLRTAHLIAGGIQTGESRHRA